MQAGKGIYAGKDVTVRLLLTSHKRACIWDLVMWAVDTPSMLVSLCGILADVSQCETPRYCVLVSCW